MEQRSVWNVPKLWKGETIYVIGGGPSLRGQKLEIIKNKRCIGVNQAFRVWPWIDVLYFGDPGFFSINRLDILAWTGIKVSSFAGVPPIGKGWPSIKRVGRSMSYGIESKIRTHISWNGNSGASAVNLAYWFGAHRVVLVGFDMHDDAGRHNFHDWYPDKKDDFERYERHMKGWPIIARHAKKLNLEIINATPGSAINNFPIMTLEEAVNYG